MLFLTQSTGPWSLRCGALNSYMFFFNGDRMGCPILEILLTKTRSSEVQGQDKKKVGKKIKKEFIREN
jgi:hypothetical protein